jgi:hypothetical protein
MKVTETQAEDVYIKAGRGNAKHRSQWIKEGKGEICSCCFRSRLALVSLLSFLAPLKYRKISLFLGQTIAVLAAKGKDRNRQKRRQKLKKYWTEIVPQKRKIACFSENNRGKQGVTG